jgi:HSP20 family protein
MSSRREIDRLRSELEDLFNEVWRAPRFAARHCFRPAVDCFRASEPARLLIVIELAGVDAQQVQIVAAERSLIVSGQRNRPKAGKGGQVYQQMEIDYGPFERRIALPDDIETESASATYEQGLLTIVFPIAARPARTASVPIQIRRGA